jgi:LmbE family N-acetylglucosaminyl deacetylase
VLRSDVQEHRHGFGVTADEREAETAAAMDVLGCDWAQWPYLDSAPDWDEIMAQLAHIEYLGVERVFAPAVEEGGHDQHNRIGELADAIFGDRVTHYTTYEHGRGRSGRDRADAIPVPFEPGWVELKQRALACYQSQIRLESTGHHFTQPLDEWVLP